MLGYAALTQPTGPLTRRDSNPDRDLGETSDCIQMRPRRIQTRLHRIETRMGGAEIFPGLEFFPPSLLGVLSVGNSAFDADPARIAPGFARVGADFFDGGAAIFVGIHQREPAVAEFRQTAERALIGAAEPDRNRALHRQRIDAGVGDLVPAAFEADQFVAPEPAQYFDLLLRATAAFFEILPQRLVFHRVPADADAEAHPAATQHVECGGLFGDEHGLTLRQDDDAGGEFALFGQSCQVTEQNQRFVERV